VTKQLAEQTLELGNWHKLGFWGFPFLELVTSKKKEEKSERFPDRSENPTILDVEESMRRHYAMHPDVPLVAIVIDIKTHGWLSLVVLSVS